MMIIDKSANE